jgi:hypothetical protein
MALSGHGDADMIQVSLEDGTPLRPDMTWPVGRSIGRRLDAYGARFFVPFSSMHRYQRDDTVWANAFTTQLDEYARGFASTRGEILPAFVRHDALRGDVARLDPPAAPAQVLPSTAFGDDWTEPLDGDDVTALTSYLQPVEHLRTFLDEVVFRVAGRDHVVPLSRDRRGRSVLFEVPRGSLMTAVKYEVFDDLLIANFMKTTFRGDWRRPSLYPDFTPYVTKYADNGRARTRGEVLAYFAQYARRAPVDSAYGEAVRLLERLEQDSIDVFRASGLRDGPVGRAARRVYAHLRRPSAR